MRWPIIIDKDDNSDFGVTVPDLPGCFSAGTSFEDAVDQAKEAIELHLEAMLEDGEDIPMPSEMSIHHGNGAGAGTVYAFVEIDDNLLSGKTERINVTLPSWANSQIERHAKALGTSKSSLLWQTTLSHIQRETAPT